MSAVKLQRMSEYDVMGTESMAACLRRDKMLHRIGNPMNYRAALYIRLSKEDESEGPSQSVTNQQSMLLEFAEQQELTA